MGQAFNKWELKAPRVQVREGTVMGSGGGQALSLVLLRSNVTKTRKLLVSVSRGPTPFANKL